jgi:hypothetical protein
VNIAITDISGTTSYTYTNAAASTGLSITDSFGLLGSVATLTATSASGTVTPGLNVLPSVGFTGTINATVAPGDLSNFIGNGATTDTVLFLGSAISGSGTATAPSNTVFFGGGADASGILTVTYNFTAASTTPEPATMTLFGSALLGLGFFARQRIKKN